MIIIIIIIHIALFSYSFVALYNDQVNVEPKSLKNIIKYRDKLVTKLKKYIYIIQKMKVKNLRSKNTKIKLQIMKKKKRVLKIKVKNHRLL